MRKFFSLLCALFICLLFVIQVEAGDLFSVENTSGDEIYITDTGIWTGAKSSYEVFGVTGDTITAAESDKTCILDLGGETTDAAFTLPAAVVGLKYTFIAGAANQFQVDPDSSGRIMYSTCATGDQIRSSGDTVADSVTLICGRTNTWYVVSMKGAWTDYE